MKQLLTGVSGGQRAILEDHRSPLCRWYIIGRVEDTTPDNILYYCKYVLTAQAIANGHTACVELLLARPGLGINIVNKFGFSALILAAGLGNTELVEMLVAQPETDVNLTEANRCSALMIAAMHGHAGVAAALLVRYRFTNLL